MPHNYAVSQFQSFQLFQTFQAFGESLFTTSQRITRHVLAGHVWHITHRCHQKQFLLKFPRDRRRYVHWVFEAKKRFGLCVA
jgi:hypothetical protein